MFPAHSSTLGVVWLGDIIAHIPPGFSSVIMSFSQLWVECGQKCTHVHVWTFISAREDLVARIGIMYIVYGVCMYIYICTVYTVNSC